MHSLGLRLMNIDTELVQVVIFIKKKVQLCMDFVV